MQGAGSGKNSYLVSVYLASNTHVSLKAQMGFLERSIQFLEAGSKGYF